MSHFKTLKKKNNFIGIIKPKKDEKASNGHQTGFRFVQAIVSIYIEDMCTDMIRS